MKRKTIDSRVEEIGVFSLHLPSASCVCPADRKEEQYGLQA